MSQQLTIQKQLAPLKSPFSFCFPTSLAFFHRLTWEQTPWLLPSIPLFTAQIISRALEARVTLTPEIITYALPFGVAYTSSANAAKEHYPNLYIIFPHLGRDVSRDRHFLTFWHNEIVKPAFDEAWKDSGLVPVRGRPKGEVSRLGFVGAGTHTECDAVPASHIFKLKDRGWEKSVHAQWPDYEEKSECDKRALVFYDAWVSIRGMLQAYDEYQGAVLLAVWKCDIVAEEGEDRRHLADRVSERWTGMVDRRYQGKRTFNVQIEGEE